MNETRLILVDHSGFPAAPDADLLCLLVSRAEVEGRKTAGALASLIALTDEPGNAQRYRRRLTLVFEGYDTDPREVWDVPEIGMWLRTIAAEWRTWIHFLAWDIDPQQIRTVVALLAGCAQPTLEQLDRIEAELSRAHVRFCDLHGVSEEASIADIDGAFQALYGR